MAKRKPKPKPPSLNELSDEAAEYMEKLGLQEHKPQVSEQAYEVICNLCRETKKPALMSDIKRTLNESGRRVANAVGHLKDTGRVIMLGKGKGYIPKVESL